MATGLLQSLFAGASREGCFFDAKSTMADVAVLCHEVRGLESSNGEQVFVSVRDLKRPLSEETCALGTACQVKGASLDTTLLLRVWAGKSQNQPNKQGPRSSAPSRVLGELTIPLAWLVTHARRVLYQSWVTLDVGRGSVLDESSESAAFGANSSFDRRLEDGDSLEGPRICISLCRATELGPNGRLVLTTDASADSKADRWAALLTSQRQHAAMSVALHEQATQGAHGGAQAEERLRSLVSSRAQEIEELRRQLQSGAAAAEVAERINDADQSEEASRANQSRQAEVESLKAELDRLSIEANSKIDAANERIRSLRRDRDEATGEAQRLRQESSHVDRETDNLREDYRQLADQKETLLEIVEDLHRTCLGAGLEAAGRNSIDSFTDKFRFD
mmetsp:Transcript_105249/g.296352  ORF Transcript_105249/g.296352 Transcript_105249/m.296352 type:complete len:392 (-) Transcript_105249:42-1217(-)